MKTKTWWFCLPFKCEDMDKEINAFIKKHKIAYKDSDIIYDLGETYIFVVLCYDK